jgi:hypothetical protein
MIEEIRGGGKTYSERRNEVKLGAKPPLPGLSQHKAPMSSIFKSLTVPTSFQFQRLTR